MRRLLALVLCIGACRDKPAPVATTPSASTSPSAVPLPTALSGPTSINELGRMFVGALAAKDRAALEALFLSLREYGALIYPEFVKAGEPLIGSMGLQWAWDNLEHSSRKDMKRLLEALGGQSLTFKSIETAPNQPRGLVALYPKVVVRAARDGKPIEIRAIFAIVSRDGRFRVLRYRSDSDE